LAGHLDKLDIFILRELTQAQSLLPAKPGLRSSYREIARKLGVSPGTVRNRINNMYASGTLMGSSVYPNPRILGLKVGAYAVEVSSSLTKKDVIEKLKIVKGMLFIQNFHGRLLGIAFVYENEQSRQKKLALLNSVAGAESGTFSRVLYPECTVTLTGAEWKLISRLSKGGFGSYSELAADLEISVRTLKRELSRIVAGRAILSVPTMDYRSIGGSVPADLIVSFKTPDDRKEAENRIMKLVTDSMIYAGVWEDFGMYSLILPRVVAATDRTERINLIPGVGSARIEFVDEHIDLAKTMSSYVERKIAIMKQET
jgi:DNA-binding Lrp family transcriptional regulator